MARGSCEGADDGHLVGTISGRIHRSGRVLCSWQSVTDEIELLYKGTSLIIKRLP